MELRDLRLDDTSVYGDLSSLAGLSHLGETWVMGGRIGGEVILLIFLT